MILARFVGDFTPLGDGGMRVVAIMAILLLSLVNYQGVRKASQLHTAVTVSKLAAITILLILAAIFGGATKGKRCQTPVRTGTQVSDTSVPFHLCPFFAY